MTKEKLFFFKKAKEKLFCDTPMMIVVQKLFSFISFFKRAPFYCLSKLLPESYRSDYFFQTRWTQMCWQKIYTLIYQRCICKFLTNSMRHNCHCFLNWKGNKRDVYVPVDVVLFILGNKLQVYQKLLIQ